VFECGDVWTSNTTARQHSKRELADVAFAPPKTNDKAWKEAQKAQAQAEFDSMWKDWK
jgi:hypothetical protein